MATIRSYTNLEQSRKLAEILPIETADMSYRAYREEGGIPDYQITLCPYQFASWIGVPCWSLAALLDVLNKTAYFIDKDASVNLSSYKAVEWYLGIDNSDLELITEAVPVDACYEMIMKLHEQKVL